MALLNEDLRIVIVELNKLTKPYNEQLDLKESENITNGRV